MLRAWLDAAQIATGPIFRRVRGRSCIGQDRLTDAVVADIVKAGCRTPRPRSIDVRRATRVKSFSEFFGWNVPALGNKRPVCPVCAGCQPVSTGVRRVTGREPEDGIEVLTYSPAELAGATASGEFRHALHVAILMMAVLRGKLKLE